MSWKIQGLSNAFKKASGVLADRKTGQLVRITTAGEATTALGEGNLLFLPLIQEFKPATDDSVAEAQLTGVAKVYVETATGITAGVEVSAGATGVGVRVKQSGAFVLGTALATPEGDGSYIPVLLAPHADAVV